MACKVVVEVVSARAGRLMVLALASLGRAGNNVLLSRARRQEKTLFGLASLGRRHQISRAPKSMKFGYIYGIFVKHMKYTKLDT